MKKTYMSKSTFCPIPWIFQAIRTNGDLRVCCQANVTKNQGIIRKEHDSTAFNAGRDSLNESRNTHMMKSIRLNMLNGAWSDECGRCRSEEENGLQSRRIYENEQWNFSIDKARAVTADNGEIDTVETPIVYYDFRFGNFCNLKCRMCGPTDSSAWYEDWIKLTGNTTFRDTSGEVEIIKTNKGLTSEAFNWYEFEPFWAQIEANIKNIKHIYFAGGEPMLIERHYDFLEKCVKQGDAKDITIEYNTNMSTLPSRVTNLWTHFKQVRVGASVDGYGKMIEFQRNPIKWDKVLKNLIILDGLPTNVISWLAVTVTAYNVIHIIDFMKWKLTSSKFKRINARKNRPIITHHVAHHPKHLNIRVLPNEMKNEITEKYMQFIEWIKSMEFDEHVTRSAISITNSICTYMNSDSYYADHWQEFVDYSNNLDSIRDESLIAVEPTFKKYLNGL